MAQERPIQTHLLLISRLKVRFLPRPPSSSLFEPSSCPSSKTSKESRLTSTGCAWVAFCCGVVSWSRRSTQDTFAPGERESLRSTTFATKVRKRVPSVACMLTSRGKEGWSDRRMFRGGRSVARLAACESLGFRLAPRPLLHKAGENRRLTACMFKLDRRRYRVGEPEPA